MRVAFFGQKGIPARWGGVETHVEAVATRLAERGHDVTAYVRHWWDTGDVPRHGGVQLRRVPSLRTKHLDAASHSLLAAIDAALRRFDVVHVHAIGPALFAALPRLTGRPVVVTIHALDYHRDKWGRVASGFLRLGEQSALRVANRTVVVSRGLERYYAQRGVVTEYVPNGVETPSQASPDAIRGLGLQGDDYWLSLGRWVPSKGLVELVDGFRRLDRPRPKLVVAGDDPDGGDYVEAVRDAAHGASDIVLPGMVTGRLKEALLSNARGVVTAATLEGLPIALLEAMSYGRACLVSDIDEHREAVADSDAALVVEMTDAAQVCTALNRFHQLDAAKREAMGRSGRAHVAQHYSWDRVVDRLEAIYRDVAGGKA